MSAKRSYDREFKINAVKLWRESNKPKKVMAKDLGIGKSTLEGWIREIEREGMGKAFPGEGHVKASHEDLSRLKRELAETREERDILKKALAIFSQKFPRRSDT